MSVLGHAKDILNKELGGLWHARHEPTRDPFVGWQGFGFFFANLNIKYAQELKKSLAPLGVEINVPDSGTGLVMVKLTKEDFEKVKASSNHEHRGESIRWKIEDKLEIPHTPEEVDTQDKSQSRRR